jgi:polar amino acid transport system permease protein
MAVGTGLGAVLAVTRLSHRRSLVHASLALTELTRNVPTFVFLFYLAFLIPAEIPIGGGLYAFPAWLKASLALAIAVVGFVSDNLSDALKEWRAHNSAAALMFIPSWTSYFVLIVMASSTASVIGVGELVSRCNTVIAAVGRPELMLWIYLYAMLWFFVFCYPLSLLMRRARTMMARRLPHRTSLVAADGAPAPS